MSASTERIPDDDGRFDLTELDPPVCFDRRQWAMVTLGDLWDAMLIADEALNGDSNDAEHDALFDVRETLSELFERGA